MGNISTKAFDYLKTLINVILIGLQLYFIFLIIFKISALATLGYWIIEAAALVLVLSIVYKKSFNSFKITWILIILLFPVSGIVLYCLYGNMRLSKSGNSLTQLNNKARELLKQNAVDISHIEDLDVKAQIYLSENLCGFPAYKNTYTKYLEIGEVMHRVLLEEIKKAEKFIFLEYFIIAKGKMQKEFLEALIERAACGVEIKLIYDEGGSIGVFPKDFRSICNDNNIACIPFNPFSASIYKYFNFRNHRKITVIDGNTCISGGINIGDEYINYASKLGHWKDMSILVKGEAVLSFTIMFIDMWNALTGSRLDYSPYLPDFSLSVEFFREKGLVMPYCDGPYNKKNPAEKLYMKLITCAKDYIYITTPYLILDSSMLSALGLAAKSGVDVRIVTPYIGDKWFVHATTRAFYGELISEGVRIYEYTPGFMHGKTMVCDDKVCIVGSVNLDFRSFIWNFECGTWVYNSQCVMDLKKDFLDTIEKSQEMLLEFFEKERFITKLYHAVLRLAAPLM